MASRLYTFLIKPSLSVVETDAAAVTPRVSVVVVPNLIIISNFSCECVTKNIEIFPNPFSDKLKIISKDILDSVIIYDSYGRKVIVTEPSARTTEINLSHLKSNVYYILTSSGGKINTKKIIRI